MFSSISGLYTIVIGHEPGSYQSLTYVTKGNTSIGGEQRKRKSKKNATKPSQDNQRKKKKKRKSVREARTKLFCHVAFDHLLGRQEDGRVIGWDGLEGNS